MYSFEYRIMDIETGMDGCVGDGTSRRNKIKIEYVRGILGVTTILEMCVNRLR